MKQYLTFIKHFQTFLLAVSIIILATLPSAMVFTPQWFTGQTIFWLYAIAHAALFLVMLVRPLADVFRSASWIRPLVILRKGMGVLSASIIVSFILKKIIIDPAGYFSTLGTGAYWSLQNLSLFAHLADISAVLLLITSNNLSKRLLGKNWKRIQRLSYVYFYGSALYVYFILGESLMLFYLVTITLFTGLAWMRNHHVLFKDPSLTPQTT